jgi:hypothetical protein
MLTQRSRSADRGYFGGQSSAFDALYPDNGGDGGASPSNIMGHATKGGAFDPGKASHPRFSRAHAAPGFLLHTSIFRRTDSLFEFACPRDPFAIAVCHRDTAKCEKLTTSKTSPTTGQKTGCLPAHKRNEYDPASRQSVRRPISPHSPRRPGKDQSLESISRSEDLLLAVRTYGNE